MRDYAQEVQQTLDAALYPLGITSHHGALKAGTGEAYYVTYDIDTPYIGWANDRPILQSVEVETRYYAKTPPIDGAHLDALVHAMRADGYMEDGGPYPLPQLLPTDYVGVWMRFAKVVALE